jgi:tRNA modification GTPase
MINDTIVALATPPMKSALSIIRVSGPESIDVVNELFSGDLTQVAPNTINYGYIMNHGEKIDEVLVSVFKAPHSFTAEDVVEINNHGGIIVTRKILNLLLSKQTRLAEPGEFSRRAYLNGRINLLEAEAINDIINATNDKAATIAASGLSKQTTNLIAELQKDLLALIAHIKVSIDYPEYDEVPELKINETIPYVKDFKSKIEQILSNFKTSNLIKNGVYVALIGQPNAGKSSLLNAFLDVDKAIVTEVAGTTRDIVEAEYLLNGININFLDTAGIHTTADKIEKIGIQKSYDALKKADLILLIVDGTQNKLDPVEQDILEHYDNVILVINKSDLPNKLKADGVKVSALKQDIAELKQAMLAKLELDLTINNEALFLSNSRHLALLTKTNEAIEQALNSLDQQMTSDLIVEDLEEAYNYLQELLGKQYDESLLDEIFSKFCLGK